MVSQVHPDIPVCIFIKNNRQEQQEKFSYNLTVSTQDGYLYHRILAKHQVRKRIEDSTTQ